MGNRFDVIVVGVGAMGSSTCWRLAQRGLRVLGLERFDIPTAMGSSHGQSRMIRLAYYEHPDYVPLLRRAYAGWDELEAATGREVMHKTGGLYLSSPGGQIVPRSAQAAVQHGLPHSMLDSTALARDFGMFRVPENWSAMYEPEAGFIVPESAITAFADAALASGAELHAREPIDSWQTDAQGVTVRTARGTYSAERVIFSAGAWTDQVVADLGVRLVVTRQVMGWVWPRRPEKFALGKFPVWAIEKPDGSIYYGFPIHDAGPGLKLADHHTGAPVRPDALERDPLPGDEETFRPALRNYLPDADGPLLALRVCMYTNTPDEHFILDRHPAQPRVTLACGFSGHGFKFSPVIGEILADLAVTGKTPLPAQFLGLHRFGAQPVSRS